ncbi:hypothetical protein EDD18DRAFT_1307946 [Armillaria luteobubalina]|uniref:Vacuolar protein sorting-associated protein 41 n=1 Tax=Armillaria luteobubalina TaxID=153913 RepID=A0AA39QAU9_9AGAR|nr:hypothetical protein EDD18DRAFT_1307946 [Armillaria luteobubalina]
MANGQEEKEDIIEITESPSEMSDVGSSDEDSSSGEEVDEREEEDSDEDEDIDEEDEPALKYERIGGFIPDLFKKDSASGLAISNESKALGTHAGFVHMLDLTGKRFKSYKPHQASVVDICVDATGDFIATTSIDGQIVIISLSTTESYVVDMKRPMRTISLEPNFAKKSTRSFVSGGLAGSLVLHEKGWLGHRQTVLHVGEGPIWQVRWRGRLIAWANDLGVKIYDTTSQSRITFIDRPADSPRADLFKCTLHWQDDSTLLISWADHIKVARIRARPRTTTTAASANLPPLLVEITAVFQLDCMIAGILPHPTPPSSIPYPDHAPSTPSSLLILAYSPPDTSFLEEMTQDRDKQARKVADREELAADALSVTNYQSWGCNDYVLAEVDKDTSRSDVINEGRSYCDRRDHVHWLVERKRYEEALEELEIIEASGDTIEEGEDTLTTSEIGQRYIEHLINDGDFVKAAQLCPKHWIFTFAEKRQLQVDLQAIIPFVPTENPQLDHLVYEMMLAHFLAHDRHALQQTIKEWPKDIYDIAAVIVAVRAELDKTASTCLAELYTANRQHGKALTYFLRLRRPNVLDVIREHNLFTDVQDQVLLLVEFDHERMRKMQEAGEAVDEGKSDAISLLVDNIHSIRIQRVVPQLQSQPRYLFLYLDALVSRDPHLVASFADMLVKLYAEYARQRLVDFFRASTDYNLETAYNICQDRDLVPEMVYLLGRMGNNKKALTLIIEKLGDVRQAIEFAKEQADDDLWEDLLKYSESRPAFIRGLLENVGPEINPIRLIRRIKNGLEIPGLKEALIKILQDFQLQISLLDGCQTILNVDISDLSRKLYTDQTSGFFLTAMRPCPICTEPLQQTPQSLIMLFLCRHVVHASCVSGGDHLPPQPDPVLRGVGIAGPSGRGMSGKIAFESIVRARIEHGCPVCHNKSEGLRSS